MLCITVIFTYRKKGNRLKEQIHSTREKILEAGKKEFLENGFRDASLRTIVKEAGVTTGAFYGYYKSKEDLFDALVAEPYEKMMERYERAQVDFANLPPQEQSSHMGDISGQCIEWMTEYMYEEHDAFYLLLCCAVGTKYENFVHHMVEIEVEYTHKFMDALDSLGQETRRMDSQLEHILVSGMFSAFFEIIIHNMPLEQARGYVKELREFYMAGWKKIMGL